MCKMRLTELFKIVALVLCCHLSFISINVYSQSWRGLTLGVSDCDDLKKVVGIDSCPNFSAKLEKEDEIVIFSLAVGECNHGDTKGFRLPKGTLEHILVINRFPKSTSIKDFGWDKLEFESEQDGDILGSFVFKNRQEGIRFTAGKREGPFSSYSIFPGAEYDHRSCPANTGIEGHL